MKNYEKMLKLMEDVSSEMAERDELIKYIAVALLAKKNLFILGDTGQSKSGCINAFRKRITGAKQFERLKDNRLDILRKKQRSSAFTGNSTISLDELTEMQDEVHLIKVPDAVNEIMDDILCVLRSKGIHISDRKYFNYTPIVQAAAYLRGADMVTAEDLKILKNYFWTTPAEIKTIDETLEQICENPLSSRLSEIVAMADEAFDDFNNNLSNNRAFGKVKNELIKLYSEVCGMTDTASESDKVLINETLAQLEKVSKQVYELKGYTVVPLKEAYEQQI